MANYGQVGHDRLRRDFHRTAHLCRGRIVHRDCRPRAVVIRTHVDTNRDVVTIDNILMAYVMGIHVFRGSCHGHVTGDDEKTRVPMFRNSRGMSQDSI